MITLRPHHLLCIGNYTGKGYDRRFTENMDRVAALLQKEPATEVRLADGCDDLCRACPNRIGDVCRDEAKIRRLDGDAARACGIEAGETIRWEDVAERAKKNVLRTGRFEEICAVCSWYALCKAQIRLHNEKTGSTG